LRPAKVKTVATIIERAKPQDVDLIKQVLSETWIDTYAPYVSRSTIDHVTTHWHDPQLLRMQIEKAGDYFAVAREGAEIVGLITVIVVTPEELYLQRLYIHPRHQRQGIGTALLSAAIAEYPAATTIRLEVEQRNAKGLSYWRKQHFVEVATRSERIGMESMQVVVMERRLR
jgi:ribosomal protein S18 acetylase RimI-like enzyme